MMTRLLLLLALCCLGIGRLSAQVFTLETVPDPKQSPSSHYVSNPTGILSATTVPRLDSMLGRLEDSATAQVAVVVLPSIGEAVPKDFATALFQKWGIGRASKDNGLLILFVLDQRRVEFETGYGLEGVLPDLTCGRIQREQMVPAFQSGDYNTGMLAGVSAVSEVLLQPAAVCEIYASEPIDMRDFERMEVWDLFVLAFLLCGCLSLLWMVRRGVRAANPVKKQIDEVVRKAPGRVWLGLFLYCGLPFWLSIMLGYFDAIYINFDLALLGCYLYIALIIAHLRYRQEKVFTQLYGRLPEPQRYARLRTATRFYWVDALFWPLPFLWLWYDNKKRLHTLRYHPRFSPEGQPLFQVADGQKAPFLTPFQKVEEQLQSVEYDVWRNENQNFTEVVGYEILSHTRYSHCEKCASKALAFDRQETISAANAEKEGRAKRYSRCKACGEESGVEILLPLVRPNTSTYSSSSSGSSWSGSSSYSGGSSSGSSWGGGRSGGGGAGSSW